MSALVSLPMQFTARRFARANTAVRLFAGVFSVCFGLVMIYQIGVVVGLFGSIRFDAGLSGANNRRLRIGRKPRGQNCSC